MPIPPFNAHGRLPDGLFDCTLPEVEERFGRFQTSDRRHQLWSRFKEFLGEVKAAGDVIFIILNGSFVTSTPSPNDIDLVLVVPEAHNFQRDLSPAEYNVLSRRRVHRRYGFDVLVARAGSEEYDRYVHLFRQVRFESGAVKGILRLTL
jgi:hypothetical protein